MLNLYYGILRQFKYAYIDVEYPIYSELKNMHVCHHFMRAKILCMSTPT
jgi:hypothetical protein